MKHGKSAIFGPKEGPEFEPGLDAGWWMVGYEWYVICVATMF